MQCLSRGFWPRRVTFEAFWFLSNGTFYSWLMGEDSNRDGITSFFLSITAYIDVKKWIDTFLQPNLISGLHAGICLVSFLHDAFSQRDNCWFCRHKTNLFSLLFRFCNFVVKHFVIFILKRYHTNTILLLSHGCLKHFCSIF